MGKYDIVLQEMEVAIMETALLVVSIFLNFKPFFHICQVLPWHPLLPDAYMYSE